MNAVKFLILVLIGLAIRVWLVPQWADIERSGDYFQYEKMAENLLKWGTFSDDITDDKTPPKPNALRTPGYPMFLATIYAVTGRTARNAWRVVQLAQALLDLLTCWLVYRTARELFRDRLVGFWSLGTALIAPPLLIFTGYIMTETLATFWTTLAVFCTLKACRANHTRWFIGLGISCAAATLIRPALVILPVFLVPAFFMTPEGRRFFTPKRVGLAFFCGLFILTPWATRNAISLGQFNFLCASRSNDHDERARGYHKWVSTWLDSQAYNRPLIFHVVYQGRGYKPDDIPSIDAFPPHAFVSDKERNTVQTLLRQTYAKLGLTPEIDAEFRKLADERIRKHPVRYYVILPLYRMLMLWAEPLGHWFMRAPVRIFRTAQLINIAIVAFGFAGMWVLRHHWRDTAPLWLAMWACTIGGVITCFAVANVNPRFVVPAYPVMCIFASACAFHLTRAKSPLKTSTEIYEPDSMRW
jgi:4-amino-4-deoxy-L-arabinose transferase-like glycosyltransferase